MTRRAPAGTRRAGVFVLAYAGGCTPDVQIARELPAHDDGATDSGRPAMVVRSGTTATLHAVRGTGPGDVWAVGERGAVVRWNGREWSPVPSGSDADLESVWASTPSDAWAVGTGRDGTGVVLHWDGHLWMRRMDAMAPTSLRGVWGSRADDVWAVGGSSIRPSGAALHWDGMVWSPRMTGMRPTTLLAVQGSAPDDVWAVGAGGPSLRWNGAMWLELQLPMSSSPLTGGLWVAGRDDVWATAMTGVMRYTPAGWSAVPAGGASSLRGIWGTRDDDVWAVGPRGTIAHWNGTAWSVTTVTTQSLWGVWGSGASDVWAVGEGGTVVRLGM